DGARDNANRARTVGQRRRRRDESPARVPHGNLQIAKPNLFHSAANRDFRAQRRATLGDQLARKRRQRVVDEPIRPLGERSSKERVEPERQANERDSKQNRVPKRQRRAERRRPAQHAANLVASTRAQPRGARRRLEHEAHPADRLEQRWLSRGLVALTPHTTRANTG